MGKMLRASIIFTQHFLLAFVPESFMHQFLFETPGLISVFLFLFRTDVCIFQGSPVASVIGGSEAGSVSGSVKGSVPGSVTGSVVGSGS